MNYYRRFIGDYLRDTMHLTPSQDGFYNRLLDLYYTTEKPLSLEREKIYICVRANTEENRQDVNTILLQFFKKTKFGYRHKRADEELKNYQSIVSRNTSNARKKRASGYPVATQSVTQKAPTPAPTPTPEEEDSKDRSMVATPPSPAKALLEIWANNRGSLPAVRSFTNQRVSKCTARLRSPSFSLADFTEAVVKASSTSFLTGGNDRGWTASFDWFIANDTNYVAVLEGKYDKSTQAVRYGEVANRHTDRQKRVLEERRLALSGDRGLDDADFRALTAGVQPH